MNNLMRTVKFKRVSDDALDMLDGFLGQMSDGVGENHRWCTKYWSNIEDFIQTDDDYSAVVFDNTKLWQKASDKEVIKDLLNRFLDITNEGMNYLSQAELYWDMDKRDNYAYGVKIANEIVEALGGEPDYFEA